MLAARMADRVPIVVILGATGAGKSKLALELAARFGGEIVNADAMQMYKGLNIVTNKVTAEEQARVPHHAINILEPAASNTVVDFRNRALPIVERLLREGRIPFICGGTNYYIESLLWKLLVDQDTPLLVTGAKRGREEGETVDGDPKDVAELKKINFESDDNSEPTCGLYSLLQRLDPDRAAMLHRNERRKIWRSLQVLKQHGRAHSALVAEQGGALGGGLRFPRERICLLEVWSEQAVLDARCDARVGKMVERGLIQELTDFHERFNMSREEVRNRVTGEVEADYTRGIWQSIGFKEFHSYLCLTEEQREGEEGRLLFEQGVQLMKIATRQYARKQVKWMRRFLISERRPPDYYRVDSSLPAEWREAVLLPAEALVAALLEGRRPDMAPLPLVHKTVEDLVDDRRTHHCDLCDRDFKGSNQYRHHLASKPHRKMAEGKGARQKYELHVRLESFNPDARNESAKILKNTFTIGLSDVFSKMDSAPIVISVVVGSWGEERRVRSLVKELGRKGIVLTCSKVLQERGEEKEVETLNAEEEVAQAS